MTTSTHSLRFATSRQIRWGGALAFAALGALAAPSARADATYARWRASRSRTLFRGEGA